MWRIWFRWGLKRVAKNDADSHLLHEELNALTCVIGFIELAKSEPNKEKRDSLMNSAIMAGQKAANIVKQRMAIEASGQ